MKRMLLLSLTLLLAGCGDESGNRKAVRNAADAAKTAVWAVYGKTTVDTPSEEKKQAQARLVLADDEVKRRFGPDSDVVRQLSKLDTGLAELQKLRDRTRQQAGFALTTGNHENLDILTRQSEEVRDALLAPLDDLRSRYTLPEDRH